MNSCQILYIMLDISLFTLDGWVKLGAIFFVIMVAFLYHRSRLNRMKDQKSEFERRLLEQKELLAYANGREQKAREQSAQADRTKSMLLAKMSHEIRTPMNGVIGMASLLAETSLSNEQKEYTDTIRNCSDTLLRVINEILMDDILEYSKIESGKELEPKDFDLRNSIEEVLDVFAAKAAQAGLDLLYCIDSNVPAQIVGDVLRLRQILMNLVENAIRFTRAGEIFIQVHLLQNEGDNGIRLEFVVTDTGSGMSAEKIELLSHELSSSDASTHREGSGLGLVISKRLIGLMGGSIKVKSRVGEGTTFKFNILTRSSLQPLRAYMHHEMAGVEGRRILIVDDNQHSRMLLESQLEQWKMVPVPASSGAQALAILGAGDSFDLVFSDLQMPGMDGIELAKAVKGLYPHIPVILLNHRGDERFRQQPELFSSVLNKPLRQHDLSKHILIGLHQEGKEALSKEQTIKQKLSENFSKQYPLKILIAEDDAINQQLAMKILNKLGYQPQIAQNGKDVLEIVSQKNYDLILMDVQMPEMDGLEATRMIRLCLNVQPVIVAMTANTMQGDREECLRSGMDDYISKPVSLEDLINILEKWALQVREKV